MPAVADGQLWVWGDAAGVIWVGAVGVVILHDCSHIALDRVLSGGAEDRGLWG